MCDSCNGRRSVVKFYSFVILCGKIEGLCLSVILGVGGMMVGAYVGVLCMLWGGDESLLSDMLR